MIRYRASLQSSRSHSFTATARRQEELKYRSRPNSNKAVYPEALQIYDAGIQKTAFIQTFKISTVGIFVIYCSVLAPFYYHAPDDPYATFKALGAVCAGALPMAIVGYATAPFVNSVMLHLPLAARRSRDAMLRYTKDLPKDAELDLVTARVIGFRKTSPVRLSDLRVLPPSRFRFANFRHIVPKWQRKLHAQRPAWKKALSLLDETRSKFYIKEDKAASRRSRAPGVWELVVKQIKENGMGK